MFVSRLRIFIFDRIIFLSGAAACALQLVMWVLVFVLKGVAGRSFILHYNIQFGVDFIGSWAAMFTLPSTGLLFLCADFLLAFFLFLKFRNLSYVLATAGCVTQIGLLAAMWLIYLLNT